MKPAKQDIEEMGKQTLDTGGIVRATSSKGKPVIVTKIETPTEQESEAETINLRKFKDHPIEYLQEALQREYEVEGNEDEIELEYDEMTESDVEREVQKLKPEQKAHFKEIKNLLTIQARLKGKVPTMGHLIQTYVKGRFPGIPSDIVEVHAEVEEPEKQDISKVKEEEVQKMIIEHDRQIPRQQAVIRPGRKGVTMSIDLYNDVEIYEVDIKDKIVEVITLTDTPKKKMEEITSQKVTDPPARTTMPIASTSKKENIVVTDIISQNIAKDYVVEKDEGEDSDETMSISSTSTADYDRDEAEDLVAKIALCHTALAKHYEDINGIIPHMSKTQMATYLGKIPIMPLVKPEAGPIKKIYLAEDTSEDEHVFPVVGETWEDKLKYLVEHVPAEKLMLAITIGDLQLNQTSQAKISMKYSFPKTRIQRIMSQDPAHCKGGCQYQAE